MTTAILPFALGISSMFSFFRKGVTAKIMLAFLGLALFAMVVTGFGTGGSGLGGLATAGGTVIQVGDEEISATELSDQIDRQLSRAREQQPELDVGTFLRGGAFDEIIRQLVSAKALLSFGRDAGLAASKRMIDGEIASIPSFQNLAGEFDNNAFQAALQRERITEQQLRDEIEASMIQRQLLLPVGSNVQVPQGLALQYASLLLERRTGSVGLVPAQAMPAGDAPTTAQINAFYNQNKARYTVPERRVLRYAIIGPEQVGGAAPTDAEIQAFYTANAARYAGTETRDLSQVVLPSQAAAQQFAAKLAGGTSFAQAAAEAGFSNADTARPDQSQAAFAGITSQAVANAAFSAAQGAVTAPVQSDYGWHVVRVDAIERTAGRTIAEARDEIAQTLAAQKKQDAVADLLTRIEDALADGSTFDEVARANNIAIRETPPITATGASENGQPQPEIAPLLETGFEMAGDEDPVVEAYGGGGSYAVLDIGRIMPAAPPPLAQIAEQVRADFIAKRAADRARQVAAAIATKVNGGAPIAQAFGQAGVALPPVEPVDARRLEIAQGGQQVPPPLAMMFSMKAGTAKILQAPNGAGWFVVHLATTEAGNASSNPALVQATRQQFSQILGEEYVQQFTNAVQKGMEIERDEEGLVTLRQQLEGPSGL